MQRVIARLYSSHLSWDAFYTKSSVKPLSANLAFMSSLPVSSFLFSASLFMIKGGTSRAKLCALAKLHRVSTRKIDAGNIAQEVRLVNTLCKMQFVARIVALCIRALTVALSISPSFRFPNNLQVSLLQTYPL